MTRAPHAKSFPIAVHFQNACRSFPDIRTGARVRLLVDKAELTRRVSFLLGLLCDGPSSVNVRFCGSEEMRGVNASFRGKDVPTDVLSFPAGPGFSDTSVRGRPLYSLGDLLVCVPVCHAQARVHRSTHAGEFQKMIVHGLVHLKGFDHERSDAAWRVMSALEKALVKQVDAAFGAPGFIGEALGST